LPVHEDVLGAAIRKHWTALQNASDANFVGVIRNVAEIGASLQGYGNEDVLGRIEQMRQRDRQEAFLHPKIEEFDLLGNGFPIIGRDAESEPLYAETLAGTKLGAVRTREGHALLDSIVAVHRLRAVICLYGFTRLEPAPTMSEALLEDVRLAVDGAPLAENADWLPAMEQRGEGIFLKITPAVIRAWLTWDGVRARGEQLERGISRYRERYGVEVERPGLPYVLLHSLAHALMEQIALECGYPLSSLRERVYAFPAPRPDMPDRFGILIYTASAGAQGTLGGLVEIANRIPDILNSALDRMRLCSNDPVCADHDHSVAGDERSLQGAACHACLLVPETSCEARNVHLDRALLIETVAQTKAAIFGK
jgi:Domain of unknown function (DUF1998)